MSKNFGSGQEKIAIVGGGMSAIYAYWGCLDAGVPAGNIEIMTHERIHPAGAMFMYECPIDLYPEELLSILVGDCDIYARKQWQTEDSTSAHKRFDNGNIRQVGEPIWDPNTVLPILWSLIPNIRKIGLLSPGDLDLLQQSYKAVICTFPDREIRETYNAEGWIVFIPVYRNSLPGTHYACIYNGLQEIPWVRQTIVPGSIYTEYPHYVDEAFIREFEDYRGNDGGNVRRLLDLKPGTPPLDDDEIRDGNLLRVGRLATFRRSALSHSARYEVREFLENL